MEVKVQLDMEVVVRDEEMEERREGEEVEEEMCVNSLQLMLREEDWVEAT